MRLEPMDILASPVFSWLAIDESPRPRPMPFRSA